MGLHAAIRASHKARDDARALRAPRIRLGRLRGVGKRSRKVRESLRLAQRITKVTGR